MVPGFILCLSLLSIPVDGFQSTQEKSESDLKKVVMGNWKADAAKTEKHLKSIKSEEGVIKKAGEFCKIGIVLNFLSTTELEMGQGGRSRKTSCKFGDVKKIKDRQTMEVELQGGKIIIALLDRNSLLITPRFSPNDPDPPLVFSRLKKSSSKGADSKGSGKKDDKKKDEKKDDKSATDK